MVLEPAVMCLYRRFRPEFGAQIAKPVRGCPSRLPDKLHASPARSIQSTGLLPMAFDPICRCHRLEPIENLG